MKKTETWIFVRAPALQAGLAVTLVAAGLAGGPAARADDDDANLQPGHLLLSKVVYNASPDSIVQGVTQLPPNCTTGCKTAIADATYPIVFNNDTVDGSFGITTKIVLDELSRSGHVIQSIEAPNSSQHGITPSRDQMVGSFSSKSELALNLSTDRRFVTFMGYLAPIGALDVSNSNTPAVVDPTNPIPGTDYRVVAQLDRHGHFRFTKTNAYSGNNGRAAILNDRAGASLVYTAGNAGNGGNPQPSGIIVGGGAQIMTPSNLPLNSQIDPGIPTPVGSFNITQVPPNTKTDKIGKDTNFRGLTIFNNVVYYTKGSGGNGINTVYFIDTSGSDANGNPLQCPNGTGLPKPSASLPASPIIYSAANLPTKGVFPYNMCILNGFTTVLAKNTTDSFPFGVWFANANTLYVADEGDAIFDMPAGTTYQHAAGQLKAGLQKWVFDGASWNLKYVLQAGLDLGVPYTIANYPTGPNAANKNLPWSPATDGLRNLTGRVNRDGTVTLWAITSTVSGSGDQGADPNKLVTITDSLAATTLPAGESFTTVKTARSGEALRGVSFTPGTGVACSERRDPDDACEDDDDR
jgi:hypothetical protein